MAAKKSIARVARAAQREDTKAREKLVKDATKRGQLASGKKGAVTVDSFVNFAHQLGIGADNPLTTASYGFNPITRIRTLLEWIYRGSWLAGVGVDVIAEDMTRAGVELLTTLTPDKIEVIENRITELAVWERLSETIKWSRLYGGAVAVMLIDGQSMKTPLRVEAVGKNQFKGLQVFDRWMLEPSLNDLVTDFGPSLGKPKYYTVTNDAPALSGQQIHYSRVVRFDGIVLPYWQSMQENLWGISIIERMYDRMIAFDSATTGAAQLVYRSYIRTYKIEGLRQIIATGGDALAGLVAYVDTMRRFQGTEGITLLDGSDEFEVNQRQSFAGLDDIMDKFGEQISGALQVPIVRLFGQSPKGLNATGDSDLRTYYDGINQRQERELRIPVVNIYQCAAQSLGIKLPPGTNIVFKSLWQLNDTEKADIAVKVGTAVAAGMDAGMTQQAALKELRQSSGVTGIFSNITDDEITAASDEPPPTGADALQMQADLAGGNDDDQTGKEGGADNPKKNAVTKDSGVRTVTAMKALHDLDIVIENERGSTRQGTDRRGRAYSDMQAADYGFIRRTTAEDGAEVDCFVGPNHSSPLVTIIHTKDIDTGAYDEPKVMLAYNNPEAALYDYSASYSDGSAEQRIDKVEVMNMEQFKDWKDAPSRQYVFAA